MFGEECTLPMDIGLPKEQSDTPDTITSPYAIWVRVVQLAGASDAPPGTRVSNRPVYAVISVMPDV